MLQVEAKPFTPTNEPNNSPGFHFQQGTEKLNITATCQTLKRGATGSTGQ